MIKIVRNVSATFVLSAFVAQSYAAPPEIGWSIGFNPNSSAHEMGAVAFSQSDPDIVYFAGRGRPRGSGPAGEVPLLPYTHVLPDDSYDVPGEAIKTGIFVAKANAVTNEILHFSFYFFLREGHRYMEVRDLAIDEQGNVYVAGSVESFLDPRPVDQIPDGCRKESNFDSFIPFTYDGFIIKLSPDGDRVLAQCFLGGDNKETIHSIALRPGGGIAVVGSTQSDNLPTMNAQQESLAGPSDGFYALLDAELAPSVISYFGGAESDGLLGVAATPRNTLVVSGGTRSSDIATTSGALQPQYTAELDTLLLEMDATTGVPTTVTYFGGSGNESGGGIDVDAQGNIYVVSTTNSLDFPVVGVGSVPSNGVTGVGVTKFSPSFGNTVFSTYFGYASNAGYISGVRIAANDQGDFVIVGEADNDSSYPAKDPLAFTEQAGFGINLEGAHAVKWLNRPSGYELDYATLIMRGFSRGVSIRGRDRVLVGADTLNTLVVDTTYHNSLYGDASTDGPVVVELKNTVAPDPAPAPVTPPSQGGGGGGGGGGPVAPELLMLGGWWLWCRRTTNVARTIARD